jgi:hypothetical protein
MEENLYQLLLDELPPIRMAGRCVFVKARELTLWDLLESFVGRSHDCGRFDRISRSQALPGI